MIQPITDSASANSAAPDPTPAASAAGGSPQGAAATHGASGSLAAASGTAGRAAQDPFHSAVLTLVGALSRAINREESIPVEVGRAYNALLGVLPQR